MFIQNQILGMKWISTLVGMGLDKLGLDSNSTVYGILQFFIYDVINIQNQILGMKWISTLVGMGLDKLGLDSNSTVYGILQFFIYDVIKIFILLSVLIFVISYIQSYFPPEKTKKILEKFKGIKINILAALLGTVTPFCSCSSIPLFIGFTQSYFPPEKTKKILEKFKGIKINILAALLGTVTPFCSCSSIPLFIGFTSAGLPLGATFSFLISSPLVDLGSLVLLMSIFGTKIAVAYVIVGLILAVVGGLIIEKSNMEDEIEEFIRKAPNVDLDIEEPTTKERISFAKEKVLETITCTFNEYIWD